MNVNISPAKLNCYYKDKPDICFKYTEAKEMLPHCDWLPGRHVRTLFQKKCGYFNRP